MDIHNALNAAGEALKATGLDHITITLLRDGRFSVGLPSTTSAYCADCFGHNECPAVAYHQAKAKQEPKARELEIRDEIERQVRAALNPPTIDNDGYQIEQAA